jgi:hypothetical protein
MHMMWITDKGPERADDPRKVAVGEQPIWDAVPTVRSLA